jgi:hypothetical protein
MPDGHEAADVAARLTEVYDERGQLSHQQALNLIRREFGDEFLYRNKDGGTAISRKVLAAFKKLTPNAVWERQGLRWRERQPWDKKARADN